MAGYVGNVPVPQSVREDQSFTATAGQTTFNTLGYTDGTRIKVTLNGVLLEGGGVDYTATNGSDIVLTSAAAVDDILRFETFNEVQLVSNTSTSPIFKTSAILKNDTEEDIEGGRESTVIFQGEQSGGEISTLAEIEASHDGTADDEKGDLIFRTNDGNDGTSPTERLRINSAGDMLFSSDDPSLTIANTTHEDTDGGRESTIVFQGEQSGGEVSTLAQIEAAHDGTADDEKGDLIFRTNDGSDGSTPTERLKIDSSGVVNVGTASGTQPSYFNSFLNVQNNASTSDHASITITSGTGGFAGLHFGDSANGRIGQVAYNNADDVLIFTANNSERLRVQSGGGISFNGDTAVANALNDYEEGTFTPSYTTSSSDASGVNYGGSNAGTYIKIGRLIHFQLTLHITSASSFGSGTPQIHGLPYSSSGSTPTNNSTRFTISTYDVNFDGGAAQTIHAYIPTTNVSYLQVLTTNDNTVWVVNNTSAFTLKNNSFTTISGMYITN